ncbi:MAG TPA: ZIP family metal transporter, partial [Bacteroidia bacterium]|nr:ZIP family metal transporter [Bacteroidia bacterium]
MSSFEFLLLFASILASGSLIFLIKRIPPNALKLLLSFSGAYLFALSLLHLLPEVYSNGGAGIGIFILGGFFLQLLLEIFSEGIEHGHIHVHKHDHKHAFPLGVILGLCIHSFLEGMPLVQHFTDANTQRSLLAGIILHHIPVALALTSMLLASHISKPATFFYLLLFASMA